jgi:predicted GNAT family acetyltransferase
VRIDHATAAHRFTVEVDGERGVLDYALDGDTMTITHTGVPKPIAGRGIAGELMRTALAAARSQGWKVVPACSYAADYLAKHPAEASGDERQHESDLLDEALEESFPASDPPAVGGSS